MVELPAEWTRAREPETEEVAALLQNWIPIEDLESTPRAVHVDARPEPESNEEGAALPGFAYPSRLTIEPMTWLHRPDPRYEFHAVDVACEVVDEGEDRFGSLGSVIAHDLPETFPKFRKRLEADSYLSIHGHWPQRRHGDPDRARVGMCEPIRSAARATRLTALGVDLDFYKDDSVDAYTVFSEVMRWADSIRLPFSLCMHSRGLWVFWFLREEGSEHPPEANWDTKKLWRECQEAIYRQLARFGADKGKTTDLSAHVRIPGSVNSKNSLRTGYLVGFDRETNKPHAFTLEYAHRQLGAGPARKTSKRKKRKLMVPTEEKLRKRFAHQVRWLRAHARVDYLLETRRPYALQRGARHDGLRVYARILERAHNAANELLADHQGRPLPALPVSEEKLRELAELGWEGIHDRVKWVAADLCEPDPKGTKGAKWNPESEAKANLKSLAKLLKSEGGDRARVRVRNTTIADTFDVTDAESKRMRFGAKEPFPWAAKFGPMPEEPTNREAGRSKRQAILSSIWSHNAGNPEWRAEPRKLAALLGETYGIQASHKTIARDLDLLGIPRVRAARRSKA